MRAVKALASLCNCTDSPEPSLLVKVNADSLNKENISFLCGITPDFFHKYQVIACSSTFYDHRKTI